MSVQPVHLSNNAASQHFSLRRSINGIITGPDKPFSRRRLGISSGLLFFP
jgi:hypothetical protein